MNKKEMRKVPCYLVDSYGNIKQMTANKAAQLKLYENGWVNCRSMEQAERLSKQIKLLRYKEGVRMRSPFDAQEVAENFTTIVLT